MVKEFNKRPSQIKRDNIHCCTKECTFKLRAENNRVSFFCKNCGKEFHQTKFENKKFCSQSCSASFNNRMKKKKEPKKCAFCGKDLSRRIKKYCDLKCKAENEYKIWKEEYLKTNTFVSK